MSRFFMAQSWRERVCAVMKGAVRENHGANGLRHWFSPTARPWRNGAEMAGPRGLLRLHSRYGPPDRSAAQGDLCHEPPAPPGYPAEPLAGALVPRRQTARRKRLTCAPMSAGPAGWPKPRSRRIGGRHG
jgi:hypothetical protein